MFSLLTVASMTLQNRVVILDPSTIRRTDSLVFSIYNVHVQLTMYMYNVHPQFKCTMYNVHVYFISAVHGIQVIYDFDRHSFI